MPNFSHKDSVALAYDANKKRLRAEGSIILAEVMNEALHEMTTQFNVALGQGQILHIGGPREEMKQLLRAAAVKELSSGSPE